MFINGPFYFLIRNKVLFLVLFIITEQGLSQDWPVSAEVDLDDMEYHEGTC